jgi:hypothetical protein
MDADFCDFDRCYDIDDSLFNKLRNPNLFGNTYVMYGLIALAILVGSYFVYKFYLSKRSLNNNNFIGSTDIENLQNIDDNNQYINEQVTEHIDKQIDEQKYEDN